MSEIQDEKQEDAHIGREETADGKFFGIEDREAVDEEQGCENGKGYP